MTQHVLPSAQARTLGVAKVARMSDEEVLDVLKKIRWAETDGEAPAWDILHARYETKRINHSFAFSDEDACTNQAESYFSRLCRAEIGQYHRIGVHLSAYAGEMAWRENNRRKPNGTLFQLVAASAAASKPSAQWKERAG